MYVQFELLIYITNTTLLTYIPKHKIEKTAKTKKTTKK